MAAAAVVSDDHADESMCAKNLKASASSPSPRMIPAEEVRLHSSKEEFWCVIDGFVCDAVEFVDDHPGGLRKLLSADNPDAGATGQAFGFSFSRGRNAHFPQTGKRFRDGVTRFLGGGGSEAELPPTEVHFPPHGKIVILGRLADDE